ncbi:hypothetical protein [Corynebacterium liangguodongii]|uniref:hypothetical protein n=1 Tax=Corynebacterium liangguodongii TaxID=2079535 RepID=UPI000D599627|nr:hypothetical protein [Corynebacterium liangguodongii]PWB99118.1 hypothetical protein DF219_07605 [Corynebacterium liangguodongii]
MAITTQLIGTLAGGGGKTFAGLITTTGTRTFGEAGKTYTVAVRSKSISGNVNGISFSTNFPIDNWYTTNGPIVVTVGTILTGSELYIYATEAAPI